MKILHQKEKEELQRLLAAEGEEDGGDLMAVLDTFLSREAHQSVDDLVRALKNRGVPLERGFVEKALDLFCQYGFAQPTPSADGTPRYEHRHLGQHHDHLICTRCGRVEEFVVTEIENLQTMVTQARGFLPLDHRLDIYGLCRDCVGEQDQPVPLSEAECGMRATVCGHTGGTELTRRLTEMGLNEGTEIEVLGGRGGPVVVACHGCRLALGQGLSEKILIRPVHPRRRRMFGFGRRSRHKR